MVLVHLTQGSVFSFYDNEGDYWYSNYIRKLGKHDGRGGFGLTRTELNVFFFHSEKGLLSVFLYSTKPIKYSRPPNQKPASITEAELSLSYIHLGIDFSNSFITGIQLLLLRFLLSNSFHLHILVCLKHVCSAPLYPFPRPLPFFTPTLTDLERCVPHPWHKMPPILRTLLVCHCRAFRAFSAAVMLSNLVSNNSAFCAT